MRILTIMLAMTGILLQSCQPSQPLVDYTHPIAFSPEVYVCYRTPGQITVDGKLDEEDWALAPQTKSFVDIEGDLQVLPNLNTYAQMLWDDSCFYIAARLQEPHVWAKLSQRDTVIFYDNDFEVFLDPDGDTHNYFELELNALNTVWDLFLPQPYREINSPKVRHDWNIAGLQTAVFVAGSLNAPEDEDEFWTVEVAIPWSSISEDGNSGKVPTAGDEWRVNFSRVQWDTEIIDGKYVKKKAPKSAQPYKEHNWVWSPTGYVNMHMPELWGFVQFAPLKAGQTSIQYELAPGEHISWALRQLYYQQRKYYGEHKVFLEDLHLMTVPKVQIESYAFGPILQADPNTYHISASDVDPTLQWNINQNGKIWKSIKN